MPKKSGPKKERKPNDSYVIPNIRLKSTTKRILAIDPGSRNMAISVVALNEELKLAVVANSLMTNTIHDLTVFGLQRDAFLKEIDAWITHYKPDGIVIERFQTRGLQGPLIEQVSIMLGLIAGSYPRIPIKLITASTWKNKFHRRFKDRELLLDDLYKVCKTTPHQLDACLIGVYGLEVGLNSDIDYDPALIIKKAENSSLIKLVARKARR